MLRQAEGKAVLVGGGFPQAADILVRANLHGVEAVELGRIVEEVVVVHRLAHKIPCTGFDIEIHQGIGIKVFRFPQRADILIPEFGGVAVVTDMIAVLIGALDVHVAGVPVAVHGNGLRAPVGPDAEFRVAEPVGALVFPQGIKACFKFFCHCHTTPS